MADLHAGTDVAAFERVLEGEGVDDGGEHAHVVGGPVHVLGLVGDAAEDVAAADDDGDLDVPGWTSAISAAIP